MGGIFEERRGKARMNTLFLDHNSLSKLKTKRVVITRATTYLKSVTAAESGRQTSIFCAVLMV